MASIDDLVSNLKNAVTNIGQLNQTIKNFFPQNTGTSATATAGAATLPANPVAFITLTLQNGSTVQIPYYNP